MRPIIGWAALGLAIAPQQAAAMAPPAPADQAAVGLVAEPGWMSLRARPFNIARLIGPRRPRLDDSARVRTLDPAPAPDRLISFARSSIDAPSTSLPMRDAPRFSRLPGKQVDDYEIGLRTALADDAVTLQAGLSYNKFRNLQTTLRQGNRLIVASVGRAKTYGLETMARWRADDHVSLFVTAAYREGRFKNRLRDGRKFRLTPDRSTSIGAVMLLPVGTGRIAFIPSLAYQSTIGVGGDGGSPALALVNAQIGYAFSDGFEVEALASNLLRRRTIRPTGAASTALIAGEPRVLGVRARLRFGADR